MSKEIDHAGLLYGMLPALYRERDKTGDLEKFLNGCGLLLDQVHNTLRQRYADIFPDSDDAYPLDSQAWLLPYIAALLDVRMVSPLEGGRREEIARAIDWRKGKGTLAVAEQITEAVGGSEAVVHEGWKRVATTARVGMPLLPLESFGYAGNAPDEKHAPLRARHPGLPAGTVDLRCLASAVETDEENTAARVSTINGVTYRWRRGSLHGAPKCREGHTVLPVDVREPDWIPGYFDDPSVRTVDFRNPGWRQGHFHPRRMLLYIARHPGFFGPVPAENRFVWSEELLLDPAFRALVDVEIDGDRITLTNKTAGSSDFVPVVIRQRVKLEQVESGTGPVNPSIWRFTGFVFRNTVEVDSGRLELAQCAALAVEVHSTDLETPVLTATDCLFKRIQTAKGLSTLQYVTVLATTVAERLHASDSIFNGRIRKDLPAASLPGKGCLRYSSVEPAQQTGELNLFQTVASKAVFFSDEYGDAGCGVLHPSTPDGIATGAEDGSEMGACHHLYIIARRKAIVAKLRDFLPAGIEPVVIPDSSLHELPGALPDDEQEA